MNYFTTHVILTLRGFSETGTRIIDGEININVYIPIETDEPILGNAQLYEQDALETINLNVYHIIDQLSKSMNSYCPLVGAINLRPFPLQILEEKLPQNGVVWEYEPQAIRELADKLGVRLLSHYFQDIEKEYFDDLYR